MKKSVLHITIFVSILLLLCCIIVPCIAKEIDNVNSDTFSNGSGQIKQILILESQSPTKSYGQGVRGGIQSVLDPIPTIRYTTESLNTDPYRDVEDYNAYLDTFSEFLSTRYQDTTFDAIIAVNDESFEFIRKYRATLFPDVPVISSSIYVPELSELHERDIAFVRASSVEKTLELMMNQYPGARSLYTIMISSQGGESFRMILEEFIEKHPDWVDNYYLSPPGLTSSALLAEMKAIPDLDIVFLQGYDFPDGYGRYYPLLQDISNFIEGIDAPFYVIIDTYNGTGVLGGFEAYLKELGATLAHAAVNVANGKEAEGFFVESRIRDIESRPVFSYDALERFAITEKSLPPHAVIVGGPKTTIPVSNEMLYGGSILLLVLFAIVCVLVYGEIQVRRANTEVIKEKELLEKLISIIPIGICVMDAQDQRKHLLFNNKLGEILGIDPKEVIGKFFPLEPLRRDEDRGESLSARCIRTRRLNEAEITYITPTGPRTLYSLCYPTFDENDNVHQIVVHYVDRTEERAFERDIENSLAQFKAFFEQDIVAVGLYEPVYENECLKGFILSDVNDEFGRLTGVSREHLTDQWATGNEPCFESWPQILKDRKPLYFDNWYLTRVDKYLSGYAFLFGKTRKYLCVTALDTTRIVRLRRNEQMLLEQIDANFQKLNTLNTAMKQPLSMMQSLLAGEESSYLSIIEEQLNIIVIFIDKLEQGFILSEKVQLYLKTHINIDVSQEEAVHEEK